jgi:hypothetical protein
MPTQISLDLRGEGLRALWKQLPERCRSEAIAIWTQLIACAAQSDSRKNGIKVNAMSAMGATNAINAEEAPLTQ